MSALPITESALVLDIRQMIDNARQRAAMAVNAELSGLYWQVGQRIHHETDSIMKSTDTKSTDNRPMIFENRPMIIRTITSRSVTRMSGRCSAGDAHD